MSNRLVPISANSEHDNPDPDTLFISYARRDVEFAQKLNAGLQRHGLTTWVDELGIRGGEDWPNQIATAIEGCKAMLVILSPDSVASRWVQRELAFADAKGKRVLPLLYKPCRLPAWFELRFGNVQRADFSRGSYETNLTKLLASIEQVLGLTVAPPAPAPAVPVKPSPAPPPSVEVEKPPPEPEPEPGLHPSLALKLSVKPQTVDAGGEATWTVTLRNDGDDDLCDVTVQHGSRNLEAPFVLAVGKERRFTFTTTCKTEGRQTERVTVSGIASSGETVRDEARATVQVCKPRPVTPKPEPVPKPKPPAKPAPDVLTITSPIHLELVRVPAGEFLMGSDPAKDTKARKKEQPQHCVYISEFYIGKYPVTNEQYAAFVKATKCKAPTHWKRGKIPSGKENHPVVNVSWDDALAFCQWLSQETGRIFRLPTEAEWEKAAQSTDGWIYPWGSAWDRTKLNSKEGGPGHTTPVGQYSPDGDSPYGCADMSGNVWEWCADWFGGRGYQHRAKSVVKDPQGPKKGTSRVLRGGAFRSNRGFVRCAYSFRYYPSYRWSCGFRAVVSPVPSGL